MPRRNAWLILLALAVGGCTPPGQRHLHATVAVDGKPVLETTFGVSDSLSPSAAWERLEGKVFEAAGAGPVGEALAGKVRLSLVHVDRPFATADLKRLSLVKVEGGWALAPGEVARTAKSIK